MRNAIPATALFACLQALSPPLQAQPSPDESVLESVRVTGTRLRTEMNDGAYPLSVVEVDQIRQSGKQTLGDFLQELSFVTGSPMSTSTTMRGEGGGLSRGISTVELRGLGAERTLVLFNGRRFVPGGNGASGVVDVSMFPMAVVERVEIYKAGASVEYGADAVAGVVNVITREQTDGLEIDAQGSISRQGDGQNGLASIAWGRRGDRGSLFLAAEYFRQPSLGKGERDYSSRLLTVSGPDNDIVPDGSSAPPGGNFRTSLGRLILREGASGGSPDDFRPFTDADRFNFNPWEDLLQASERSSLYAQGSWSSGPALRLFGEAFYQQRNSSQQLAPLPFFTNREVDVRVSADNAYNPFGEELADVRRRLVEAGPRRFEQDNTAWRFVLGADGALGDWFWDASLNRGRNQTDQAQTGDLLDDRLRAALGPSFFDTNGQAVCGTPQLPVPGCVPLNLFGGPGSIEGNMLDFVGTDLLDTGHNEQTVFGANLNGDLLALPAGALATAFGYEYREESGADYPDPQTVLGNTTGNARAVTRGRFRSNEIYAEAGIPLLAGAPGVQELALDLGARWVRFSNFDPDTVWEAGIHYRPNTAWQLRAAYNQAFRAPNVRELYGGFMQSNPIVEDPCADFSQLDPVQIERCVAQGVPADGRFEESGQETPQLGGGNPDLGPEQADTLILGFTWEPAAVESLRLSVDYYDIEIDNGIFALGAETLLGQCLATGEPSFCDRILRDAEGNIVQVSAQLQNIALETARGIDAELRFAHPVAGGNFRHYALLSYVAERDLVAFPGAAPFAGAGGFDPDVFGAIPRWRGLYQLTWAGERWELGYKAQWIGGVDESGGELYPGTVNPVSGQLYQDLFAGFLFSPSFNLSAGVDNLADRAPPFFANADEANTDVATYRLLGRSYWLRLQLSLR